MKLKSWSILLAVTCSCVLLTGCLGASASPKGWSGPIAVDGVLYVGSMTGTVVTFADIGADGQHYMQWSYPDGTTIPYLYGDPVVDNGSVYVTCYTGKVYVVNASHGYSEWKYPADVNSYVGAIVGSPAVADGTLYFGSSDKKLYAINTTTRQQVWQFQTGDKIWSTPVVYNGIVYIGSFDHKMYALNAETGAKLWEFSAGGAIVSTPVVYNNSIYFGALDQKFYAVNATTGTLKEGFTPFSAGHWFWSQAVAYNGSIIAAGLDGRIYALDAGSGSKLWEAKTGGIIRGNPALVNNLLIVGTDEGSNSGKVYCFNADTGDRVWVYPPAASGDTMPAIHASVGSNGSVVYVHATNQKIYAIDAEHGNILWSTSTGGS